MIKGVHNYSEIGKLNKVLLHRIGSEVDGLVPDNFARLLFDDIPYLKVAQQEHDRFAQILKKNGVEVVYYVDEAAKALEKADIRDRFIREMLDEVNFSSRGVKEAIYAYLIVMSPKDLKTIRFIDRMMKAGVRVYKIEGRARGPEYVYTVVKCYKEAIASVIDGTFTEEKKDAWDERLASVFNRGFWDGYYLGQKLGEWNRNYGSNATVRKVYVGRGVKYYSRLGVAEFTCDAAEFSVGDHLLITGPTTGVMYLDATEIRYDLHPVETARKGTHISIPVPGKVRPSDKLFLLVNERKTIKD